MKFYWKAMLVAFAAALFSGIGILGVTYLLGDHEMSPAAFFTAVGFFAALAVFAEGVDHLSEKADKITEAIKSVEAGVEGLESSRHDHE
jgi:hypothetical protein